MLIFPRSSRYRWVQSFHRSTQPLHQHHLPIITALWAIAIRRDVYAVQRRVANLGQPA
jgi:hypothetical protein